MSPDVEPAPSADGNRPESVNQHLWPAGPAHPYASVPPQGPGAPPNPNWAGTPAQGVPPGWSPQPGPGYVQGPANWSPQGQPPPFMAPGMVRRRPPVSILLILGIVVSVLGFMTLVLPMGLFVLGGGGNTDSFAQEMTPIVTAGFVMIIAGITGIVLGAIRQGRARRSNLPR